MPAKTGSPITLLQTILACGAGFRALGERKLTTLGEDLRGPSNGEQREILLWSVNVSNRKFLKYQEESKGYLCNQLRVESEVGQLYQ